MGTRSAITLLLLLWCDQLEGFLVAPQAPRAVSPDSSGGRRLGFLTICGGLDQSASSSSTEAVPVGQDQRETTWSNRGGKDLVQVIGDVWCAERPFLWNGIDVGGRMTVVKLSDGTLWVHSPVDLDPPLRAALDKLGPVGHIVSPNYEHVKYAKQWKEAFPSARSHACPGLKERKPEVGFTRSVGDGPDDDTPPEWGGEIEACFMDCETNPFTGKPFFNEVVFFHRPTKSFITSDLYWNYPREAPVGTRAWKWGMDKVYLPFFKRFMVTDSEAFAAKVNKILGWGIEVIIPCHGDVVRSGASQTLRETLLGTSGDALE